MVLFLVLFFFFLFFFFLVGVSLSTSSSPDQASPDVEPIESESAEAVEPKPKEQKPEAKEKPKAKKPAASLSEEEASKPFGVGAHTMGDRERAIQAVREANKARERQERKEAALAEGAEPEAEKPKAKPEPVEAEAKELDEARETEEPKETKEAKETKEQRETIQQKLDRLTKEREKAKEIRREADEDRVAAKRELEELRAERERFRQEAENYRNHMRLLEKDPLTALQKLGVDPETHLTRIAEIDPVARRRQQLEDERERELAEMRAWRKQVEEAARAHQERFEAERETNRQRSILERFQSMAKDASKYPAINELYGDDSDYIINRGHRVADHLKELLGTQPSMEDVLEYIEEDVKKKRRGQVSQRRPEQGEAAGLPKTAGRADLNQGRGASFSVPQDWESRKLAARQQIRAMRDTWERELDPEDT